LTADAVGRHDPVVEHSNPIVRALDTAGYRLTSPRRSLADLVVDLDGHFTASELAAASRQRGLRIGRATLFRALDLMIELGVVERLDLPSGEHTYVACAPAHHHHVVCSRCGRTAEVADEGLAEAVRRIEARTGFRIDSHRLEMFGLCRHCQARAADPSPADA
jgi:Fur family ferric uptake transcriptional regulator